MDSTDSPLVYSNFCRRLLVDSKRAVPAFVSLLLRQAYLAGDIAAFITGTAMPNLAVAEMLANVEILLPPIAEQEAVVRAFEPIHASLAANARLITLANDWCQAWTRHMVGVALAHVQYDEELPVGWSRGSLGDALETLATGSRPTGGVKGINEGVPSVGAESINGLARFDYEKTRFVPEAFYRGMRRGHVQSRDVLIYKDGGRPGEFEPHIGLFGDGFPFEHFAINEHVYRARVAEPLSQEYLYCWLSADELMDEMRNRGTGVAIPGLNSASVKDLPFVTPPVAVRDAFQAGAEPVIRRALLAAREVRVAQQAWRAMAARVFAPGAQVTEDAAV
jgi:type I restriction enzyme, S subunit